MATKFLNLDTDNTLGGNSPSDYKIPSQAAIKYYVDNCTQSIRVDSDTDGHLIVGTVSEAEIEDDLSGV